MKKRLIVLSTLFVLMFSGCGKAETIPPSSAPVFETAQPAVKVPEPTSTPAPTQTPTEPILDFIITEDGEVDWLVEKKLKGLTAAELYVKQLDQSFRITDPESLRELEAALSDGQEYPFYVSGKYNDVDDMETANPLYLYFEDGSSNVIYTMGDGSCGTTIWAYFGFNSNKSIFDMFGVPLEAEGYTYNADGTTTVTTYSIPRPNASQEEYHTVYAADGRVLSISSPYTLFYDGPFLQEYVYDEANKLVAVNTFLGEELFESLIFEYNEFDRVSKYTAYDSDGNWKWRYEYSYDDLGRVIAAMDYYAVGVQGAGTYYWYDENGKQHWYTYEHDGSIYGEAPPDGPIRK